MSSVPECCGSHDRFAGSCSRMCLGFNARHCVHRLTCLCMCDNSDAVLGLRLRPLSIRVNLNVGFQGRTFPSMCADMITLVGAVLLVGELEQRVHLCIFEDVT